MSVVVGVFVGGRSARMGGRPKGLLAAPDGSGTLVERIVRLARTIEPAEIVLVGSASAYAALGLRALDDDPSGVGPVGGLAALLGHAGERAAIAVSCDLPRVDADLFDRLLRHAPTAQAVAPRPDGVWQPLFARYASVPCLAAARATIRSGNNALHRVLESVRAVELELTTEEQRALVDWDTPEDAAR